MKKAKKIEASVFVIFCLIFASISAVTSVADVSASADGYGDMEVIKEVFHEGAWSEGPIEVNIGDTLQFRITITYYNTSGLPRFHYAYAIRIYDYLPDCLDYDNGSANPDIHTWTDDPNETISWDFGALILNDTQSLIVKYNATVVEPTLPMPQENNATVIWNEVCTGGVNLIDFDTLTITIGIEPEIDLIKRVWNSGTLQWVKSISAEEGDTLQFRIDVNNNGPIELTGVVVTDIYPEFLTPSDYNIPPLSVDTINRKIIWNLGTIPPYNSVIIFINATVNTIGMKITGKNYANVTCEQGLYDEDNVTITIEKHFIVDKKVRHPDTGEWVDEIPYVKKCEPVRFRINLTYYGTDLMKCLVVGDTLPMECLNYSDNLYIEIAGEVINPGSISYPEIFTTEGDIVEMCCMDSIIVPESSIFFSWVNRSFGIAYGDSVIIEFDTTVIRYCDCTQPVQNCVEAWLWGCNCEVNYWGQDCVNITCKALPGDFNKTVSLDNPVNWGEEVYTTQGDYIRFKLELTYYGNDNLTNASFLDELCCLLEYDSTIESPAGTKIDVSADKKTIWWNVTQNITDCQSIIIIFRVKVTGGSDCGGCINIAHAYGYIWCGILQLVVDRTDTATIYAQANSPPGRPDVSGPQEGVVGTAYSFKAMLTDVDNDQLTYIFSWGDGTDTGWLGPVIPGEVTQTHTYTSAGTYSLKVKARDEHGAESDWTSYPLNILIKIAKVALKLKMFNIGSVKAIVNNTGEVDISSLSWEFDISRNATLNFRDINVDGSGVIPSLPVGGDEKISSDPIGLRIGKATVKVTASKTGFLTPTTITAQAFIIGPIIIILPA